MKVYLVHLIGENLEDLDNDHVYAFTNYQTAKKEYKKQIQQYCQRVTLDDSVCHSIYLYKAIFRKDTKKNMVLWALEFPKSFKIIDYKSENHILTLQEFHNGDECKTCNYCKTNTKSNYSIN